MEEKSFIVEDQGYQIEVKIIDNGDGTLDFNFSQIGLIGDFRGIFFDFTNDGVGGDFTVTNFSATGIIDSAVSDPLVEDPQSAGDFNLVSSVGTATVNPESFDVGIEIGTGGKGEDDIQGVSFTLTADGGLTLDDFSAENVTYGFRLTSTGDDRQMSLKLSGQETSITEDPSQDTGDTTGIPSEPSSEPSEPAAEPSPTIEIQEEISLQEGESNSDGSSITGEPLHLTLNDLITGPDPIESLSFTINDTELADGLILTSPDGLTQITVIDAENGVIEVKLTEEGEEAFDSLPEGESSDPLQAFTLQVTTSSGESAESTLTYQVEGTNDAPTITTAKISLKEGETNSDGGFVSGNESILDLDDLVNDVDTGDTHSFSINGIPAVPGTIILSKDGFAEVEVLEDNQIKITLTPEGEAAQNHLPEGSSQNTPEQWDITVTDSGGKSAQTTFGYDLEGTNDAPEDGDELYGNGGMSLAENQDLLSGLNILDNSSDPDDGDTENLFVSDIKLPTLTLEADSDLEFDLSSISISPSESNPFAFTFSSPNGESLLTVGSDGEVTLEHTSGKGAFEGLDGNDAVKISFDYSVSDPGGKTNDSTAEIAIQGQDDLMFSELSNLVLYLYNPEHSDDPSDTGIVKVKFEGAESFEALKTLADEGSEFLTTDDFFVFSETFGEELGATELIAFTYKQGNNKEMDSDLSGFLPNGEGQMCSLNNGIDGVVEGEVVDAKAQNSDVESLNDLAGTPLAADNYAPLLDTNYVDGAQVLGVE